MKTQIIGGSKILSAKGYVGDKSLINAIINDKVEEIKKEMFIRCYNLKFITILKTVTKKLHNV